MKRVIALVLLFATAGAYAEVSFIPRVGLQVGSYQLFGATEVDDVTVGGNAGFAFASGRFIADLNLEALSYSADVTDVWRTEIAITLGVAVYRSAYLIGGYRMADYGESILDDEIADMTGPFLGISLAGLQMGDDGKDIFNFSFAINANSYDDGLIESDDVGVSLRLGYRRAGSPHSFGIRYQSFGSDVVDEYFTTLGYSYSFM